MVRFAVMACSMVTKNVTSAFRTMQHTALKTAVQERATSHIIAAMASPILPTENNATWD
jgi:hypothetical protein